MAAEINGEVGFVVFGVSRWPGQSYFQLNHPASWAMTEVIFWVQCQMLVVHYQHGWVVFRLCWFEKSWKQDLNELTGVYFLHRQETPIRFDIDAKQSTFPQHANTCSSPETWHSIVALGLRMCREAVLCTQWKSKNSNSPANAAARSSQMEYSSIMSRVAVHN